MIRRGTLKYLAPAVFGLMTWACTERPVTKIGASGCSDAEWRARSATSPSCAAEFQALMRKAEADAERSSALTRPAKPAPRARF